MTKKVRCYLRDMKRLIHRMNQTAHISLQKFDSFKERRDKRNSVRPNLFGAPRLKYLKF